MDNFLDFNQADLENLNCCSMYLHQYIKAIHYVIEIEFKTHFSILIQIPNKVSQRTMFILNMEGESPRHCILCQTVQNKTAASNPIIT